MLDNHLAYKRQRNLCVKLLRIQKRTFYENLETRLIGDNRKFWQTVKPSFTDKSKNSPNITLVDGNYIVSDSQELVRILHSLKEIILSMIHMN